MITHFYAGACRALAVVLMLTGICACSLLQRSAAKQVIYLVDLQDAGVALTPTVRWPEPFALGELRSAPELRGDLMVVLNGAQVMQHETLRWIDTPEVLFAAKLKARLARDRVGVVDSNNSKGATLINVALLNFNLTAEQGSALVAQARIAASIACASPEITIVLSQVSETVPVETTAMQLDTANAVARAFAVASNRLIEQLIASANITALQHCARSPSPPVQ